MKKIIYIIIILIVIFSLILFINKFDDAKKIKVNNDLVASGVKNYIEMKNKIEEALKTSKLLMEEDDDFYTYFRLEYINSNMPDKDRVALVNDLDSKDFSTFSIYNLKNQLIQEMPFNVIKDSDKDNFNIEPNKNSLIKIYSNEDKITYYYILNISQNGEYSITDVK